MKSVLAWGVMVLFFALDAFGQSNIVMNLSEVNAFPAANRTVTIQAQSPFTGNVQFMYSDTNGFIVTNLQLGVLYNGQIKAPPAAINFQLYLPLDTVGCQDWTNFFAVGGVSAYPAGATAPSVTMADARYARSGTSLTNTFYPLNNPSNFFTGDQVTNAIVGIVSTNQPTVASNALALQISTASNYLQNTKQPASLILTNLSLTGANTNTYLPGAGVLFATNVSGSTITISATGGSTNAFTSIVFTNPTTILYTNVLPALTNGFVTSVVISGLASTGYVNAAVANVVTNNANFNALTGSNLLVTNYSDGAGLTMSNGYLNASTVATTKLISTNYTFTGVDYTKGGPYSGFLSNGILAAANGGFMQGVFVRVDNSSAVITVTNGAHFYGLADTTLFSSNSGSANFASFSTKAYNWIDPSVLHSGAVGANFTLVSGYYTNLSFAFSINLVSTNWVENFGSTFATNFNGTPYGNYFEADGSQLDITTPVLFYSFTNFAPANITNNLATTNYANSVTNGFTSIVTSNASAFYLNANPSNYPSVLTTNGLASLVFQNPNTNIIGINGAGSTFANGTYAGSASTVWTNFLNSGKTINLIAGTYYIESNGVTLYSSSDAISWTMVNGASPAPYGAFGASWNMNLAQLRGEIDAPSLRLQMTNSFYGLVTNVVQNTQVGGVVSGPVTNENFSVSGSNYIYAVANSISNSTVNGAIANLNGVGTNTTLYVQSGLSGAWPLSIVAYNGTALITNGLFSGTGNFGSGTSPNQSVGGWNYLGGIHGSLGATYPALFIYSNATPGDEIDFAANKAWFKNMYLNGSDLGNLITNSTKSLFTNAIQNINGNGTNLNLYEQTGTSTAWNLQLRDVVSGNPDLGFRASYSGLISGGSPINQSIGGIFYLNGGNGLLGNASPLVFVYSNNIGDGHGDTMGIGIEKIWARSIYIAPGGSISTPSGSPFAITSASGVSINTNTAGTNALQAAGNVESSVGFTVNGVSITNGLASSASVISATNGLASTNYVIAATNSAVNFSISTTNSLASTNFVIAATNSLASTNFVISATNSLATTNYVNTVAVTNLAPNGQFGIFDNYSTNFLLPPTSQNWRIGRGTPANHASMSVVKITDGSWVVDTESVTSFWEYPFPIPPGVTNVTISATVSTLTGSAAGLFTVVNWPGSIAYGQISPTFGTTPTAYSVTSGATNQAMFSLYATGNPFVVSNINLVYNGTITDPVLSLPFKHYDVLRDYWQNNAYRGYLPEQASEYSKCEFATDANSITFELFGATTGLILPFQVYANGQMVLSINDFPTNNFYYTNLTLNSGWKNIQIINGAALQVSGASQQVDLYSGNSRYTHTVLRSIFVPTNSSCIFQRANNDQRRVFVFGDSIMLNGGQLTNNANNTLWDLVQRFAGIKSSLYAAGSWSMAVNYATSKTNFWKAVSVSDASDMWCNMGYNDWAGGTGTNNFFTDYTNMLTTTHALKPAWTIYCQIPIAAAADIGPQTNASLNLNQYRDAVSNAASLYPFCVLVPQLLTNTNNLYGGLHPTPTGNIIYASGIANWLNVYPSSDPLGFNPSSLYGNGAAITNLAATNVNFTLISTNFVSGQIYVNNYGAPIELKNIGVVTTTAAVVGFSQMQQWVIGSGTNFSPEAISAITGTLVGSTTNTLPSDLIIPVGATYTITNISSGVGNSSSIFGGQIFVY